jgi:hypothetical protein
MDVVFDAFFKFLGQPAPKVRLPLPDPWKYLPGRNLTIILLIMFYGLIVSGVNYDIISDAPAFGQGYDSRGRMVMQTISRQANSQFIIEGLFAGGALALGGVGFILLDKGLRADEGKSLVAPKWLQLLGLAFCGIGLFIPWYCFSIKFGGYLR